jgi:hypothetical protein
VSGFELAAIIVGIFFVSGIAMGVLLVMALPMLPATFRFWPYRDYRAYQDNGAWQAPPRREDDERPPWWDAG